MPGRAGRPPVPIEIKRKRGTDRADRTPRKTLALKPVDGVPPVPVSLGEEGRHYWDRYWTAASAWLSPDLDHQALESVCHLADEIAEYRRAMADEGLQISEPIVTPTGVVVGDRLVSNPAIKDLRNAEKQLRDWLSDLGFTPTARARLGLAEVRRQSKLEELLAKRAT